MELRVRKALIEDVGKGRARLGPEEMKALGVVLGDLIEIEGRKKTVARVSGITSTLDRNNLIQFDSLIRDNAQVNLGEIVKVRKVLRATADRIVLYPLDTTSPQPSETDLGHFGSLLQGYPVIAGDRVNVPLFGGKDRFFRVEGTTPSGPLIINSQTKFFLIKPDYGSNHSSDVSYEDIGGLDKQLTLVREMVELPLKYHEVFENLGVEAPKGVLIHGPPGTGKTLIARAIAMETKLHFIRVNGPEIIQKFYGESEARLREIFEEAAAKSPSIIFIDEIDAVAPKRANVLGDVEKRVVAQLLALMDGLVSRGDVVVIGATNIPEMIDPALRRPGRFDREISIPVPNVEGRLAILKIHSRRMPLSNDVSLERIARITHGFVGADLQALCKEAGMVALRRYLKVTDRCTSGVPDLADRGDLKITAEDFLTALREIEPSATREFLTERPPVKWRDIGGLAEIKETLISIVDWPDKFPELLDEGKISPPRKILFTGPSGTGKTLTAKALAGETGLSFIQISGPILFSKWLGESEKAIHEIFKKAKQSAPCILFFDEIDALVTKRGAGSETGTMERVATQFFNELDKLSDLSEVIVLGATNREDLLDPALTREGRLDFVLPFHVPEQDERIEIFKVHTTERPVHPDTDLAELARQTEGMVGSDIAHICKRATMLAIAEKINLRHQNAQGKLSILPSHFETAISELRTKKRRPKYHA